MLKKAPVGTRAEGLANRMCRNMAIHYRGTAFGRIYFIGSRIFFADAAGARIAEHLSFDCGAFHPFTSIISEGYKIIQ